MPQDIADDYLTLIPVMAWCPRQQPLSEPILIQIYFDMASLGHSELIKGHYQPEVNKHQCTYMTPEVNIYM